MAFDAVFDVQTAYRYCLRALTNPGTVVNLAEIAGRVQAAGRVNAAAVLMAYVLLDAETSFSVVSPDATADAGLLRQLTGSKLTTVPYAAFVLVLGGIDPAEAIRTARTGTLEDPHLGATVLVEVESLSQVSAINRPTPGAHDEDLVRLSGPGIRHDAELKVGTRFDWVGARNEQVRGFPMGVDVILVDRAQRLAAIPRTTRIEVAAPAPDEAFVAVHG